ncbi:hypothetical protein HPB52_011238 [Rhipicephalus sanguineus]|uniref:Uncharacterized protein n=1 Tax=Rhipicephalus sanguineus TaxID=34632 RepID=A0A9D4PSM5_RHISA|nr:hypothetical protein HPB52_011238 [Rhipicephalus sanguineus]
MAFMIPIVKKDYNLYEAAGSPKTSSPCGSLQSRSGNSSLSCSPGSNMGDKFKDRKQSTASRNDSYTSSHSVSSTKSSSKFNEAFLKKFTGQGKGPR